MPSLLDRKPPTLLGEPSGFLDTLRGLRQPGQIAGGAANYLRAQQGSGLEDRLRQASLLPVPVASDLAGLGADAMMYLRDPSSRTAGNAALSGLGLLPIIPAMTAYHGSPHKFDKFELSDKTIGTGEGAQAYGHGLYFAEDPKVAGSYKQNLSSGTPVGVPYDIDARLAEAEEYLAKVRKAYEADPKMKPLLSQAEQDVKRIESMRGFVYHVDIPDEQIAKMLDWDAPLSEQPEAVRKAWADLWSRRESDGIFKNLDGSLEKDVTGKMIYEEIGELAHAGKLGPMTQYSAKGRGAESQKVASDYLRSLGIPGIRYFDGTSRNVGTNIARRTKVNGTPIRDFVPDTGDFLIDNQLENLLRHLENGKKPSEVLKIAEQNADPATVKAFKALKIDIAEGTRNFVVFDDSILKILNRE